MIHSLRSSPVSILPALALLLAAAAPRAAAQDLVITGVVDGPLTGGVPKAIELCVLNDVPDLSIYGVGSANNGGGSDGEEFTFPAGSASAGTFLYVAFEASGFADFFGFAPTYTDNTASINGDDAIELFMSGTVADVFGDIDVDGSGEPWEYLDGWAYRNDGTGPDGNTFVIGNWFFSGPDALDGAASNGAAAVPFPIGAYSACTLPVPTPDVLLSELVVTPTGGEFVEIHNPTASSIDLSDVYLTDATFAGSGTFYYNIVTGADAGGGGFGDFHARFPDGASIAAGEFQTVSLAGSTAFAAEYGQDPTYELYEDDAVADAVPDMREALPGSINNQGGLSNAGEVVVLYTWDGASDLVQDIDYVLWGDGAEAVDKTGVGVDGPDADGDPSFYAADTGIGAQDVVAAGSHAGGDSFQRVDFDEGAETQSGGNGVTGSDETSEDLSVTWQVLAVTPGAAPPTPASDWVINEIHADPDGTIAGDANGDGTRNASQDEFVEIVNLTGGDVDISGWTLADGVSVRHTFPAGSVVFDGCSVVVFGGGTPAGLFGNGLVQTASGGSLGLNNGGDSVRLNDGTTDVSDADYGAEGGDNQSLTLDPDGGGMPPRVKHSTATGSGGALFSPGTKIDGSQFDGCPVAAEVYEIQGSGTSSPLEGRRVIATGVVTALAPNGFFIQTASDGNPDTSDGIFVFTDAAPSVAVGDQVEVTGTVDEFFGFTEITGAPVVTALGSGVVPAPIVFDDRVPSANPAAPSCSIEYECYEGMLVEIPAGIVAASNQEFGSDPFAEVHVTAGSSRPFREPGVEFPGLPANPSIPVWDGNPEVFELDPDKLGLPNLNIPAGSTFSARGVIGFEFNHYEFWPSELTVDKAPIPVPVRRKTRDEATVGSLNLFRLFDDVDDPPSLNVVGANRDDTVVSADEYTRRLMKLATYVVDVMRSPDILAVQEAEKLGVLEDLAAAINAQNRRVKYKAYLIEGNDVGTIDVGFLVKKRVKVKRVTQLGADELFSFDGTALHDRPPLLLDATLDEDLRVEVMVLHMRSLGGIATERVQRKRLAQALSVAQMVEDIQSKKRNVKLVVIGDFNAFEFTDGFVDVAGIIKGEFDPQQSLVCSFASCPDIVTRDLTNVLLTIDPAERYSFIFRDSFNADGSRGDAQILDHAMTSRKLTKFVTGLEFARGNADAAEELVEDDGTLDELALRASDHDGLVLYLCKDDDDCDDDDDDDDDDNDD